MRMPDIARIFEPALECGEYRAHSGQCLGIEQALAGQILIEREGGPHLSSATLQRLAFGDKKERITQQTLCYLRRAFHQTTHLQVDTREQLLDMKVRFDALRNETVDETHARPPEGLRRLGGSHFFNFGQRLTHLRKPLRRTLSAQECQQAALERTPHGSDMRRQRIAGLFSNTRHALYARAQIGEE